MFPPPSWSRRQSSHRPRGGRTDPENRRGRPDRHWYCRRRSDTPPKRRRGLKPPGRCHVRRSGHTPAGHPSGRSAAPRCRALRGRSTHSTGRASVAPSPGVGAPRRLSLGAFVDVSNPRVASVSSSQVSTRCRPVWSGPTPMRGARSSCARVRGRRSRLLRSRGRPSVSRREHPATCGALAYPPDAVALWQAVDTPSNAETAWFSSPTESAFSACWTPPWHVFRLAI